MTIGCKFKSMREANRWRRVASQQPRGRLFALFWPLTIAQPYIWAAAVFVNELDTNQFKSPQRRTSVGRYYNVRLGKIAALEKQRS
jgi:hypothetical protein